MTKRKDKPRSDNASQEPEEESAERRLAQTRSKLQKSAQSKLLSTHREEEALSIGRWFVGMSAALELIVYLLSKTFGWSWFPLAPGIAVGYLFLRICDLPRHWLTRRHDGKMPRMWSTVSRRRVLRHAHRRLKTMRRLAPNSCWNDFHADVEELVGSSLEGLLVRWQGIGKDLDLLEAQKKAFAEAKPGDEDDTTEKELAEATCELEDLHEDLKHGISQLLDSLMMLETRLRVARHQADGSGALVEDMRRRVEGIRSRSEDIRAGQAEAEESLA